MIDFWTYSCINCIRTLPYVKDWYAKYHHKGLVIIGVHTPEFAFEKNVDNVEHAVKIDDIHYPVALDNQFITWQNYRNHYWPAQYLINKNGYVVYNHFGEGKDEVTENNIRYLLGMYEAPLAAVKDESVGLNITPETYLGYARADRFASSELPVDNHLASYSFPKQLSLNEWALQGDWTITADKIIADKNARLKVHFQAGKVYMVMGSSTDKAIEVQLLLNGHAVKDGHILVDKHTIYRVLSLEAVQDAILEMIPSSSGLEVYTLTFGRNN